jgi:hypothetical protein
MDLQVAIFWEVLCWFSQIITQVQLKALIEKIK